MPTVIVETLQCIKSVIQHDSDLLFWHLVPSLKLEAKEHDKEQKNVTEGILRNAEESDSKPMTQNML